MAWTPASMSQAIRIVSSTCDGHAPARDIRRSSRTVRFRWHQRWLRSQRPRRAERIEQRPELGGRFALDMPLGGTSAFAGPMSPATDYIGDIPMARDTLPGTAESAASLQLAETGAPAGALATNELQGPAGRALGRRSARRPWRPRETNAIADRSASFWITAIRVIGRRPAGRASGGAGDGTP